MESPSNELAEPSIRDAFALCVKQGANRVILSPFFLFPGRHWHQDIPSLTAEAAKQHPGVSYVITAPLGLHPLLVDVVNDRIKHCSSRVAGDANDVQLVLEQTNTRSTVYEIVSEATLGWLTFQWAWLPLFQCKN